MNHQALSGEPLVDVKGLSRSFGPLQAVSNLSFEVRSGELLGFLGPNGAGKTTTMRMICGLIRPDAGAVRICGHALGGLEARRQIGYLPEGAPSYTEMVPRQFLQFIARVRGLRGDAARKALAQVVEQLELARVMEQPIATLSQGFRRRVALAQAIIHQPRVLILDEPTEGLDPNQKRQVRQLFTRLAEDRAIIISTHVLEEVMAICTRVVVVSAGRLVADGSTAQLLARSRYCGALSLRFSQPLEDPDCFAELDQVASVEQSLGGRVLTLIPESGAQLLEPVQALLKNRPREVENLEALSLEPGRLDDVFFDLTQGVV